MKDNISGNEILKITKILFSHNHFNNKKKEIEYNYYHFLILIYRNLKIKIVKKKIK